jgi:hypothetical protein
MSGQLKVEAGEVNQKRRSLNLILKNLYTTLLLVFSPVTKRPEIQKRSKINEPQIAPRYSTNLCTDARNLNTTLPSEKKSGASKL